MRNHYNLVGIGIGLFNLSLAALLKKTEGVSFRFFDRKPSFDWHSEIIFSDSTMQTSYLKDLVSPIDPTNPASFLNYLVQEGLFYSFLNTNRQSISRKEFELYCQWVAKGLSNELCFNADIESVQYNGEHFIITAHGESFTADHICLGTGLTPHIPDFAEVHIGPQVFHAKSKYLKDLRIDGKRVVVVGGGQTGIEIFRNCMLEKWGKAESLQLISSRANLEPLDNSPFVNEYFAPNYVEEFFNLDQKLKDPIVQSQKLASDGNTPEYLNILYNDLYQLKNVSRDPRTIEILPFRRVENIEKQRSGYSLAIRNGFNKTMESLEADVVILSTGFRTMVPPLLESLKEKIYFDDDGRFQIERTFNIAWQGQEKNKIYAMNFSRHGHGISEPQTSLMAWRSATIINDLKGQEVYPVNRNTPNFITYIRK